MRFHRQPDSLALGSVDTSELLINNAWKVAWGGADRSGAAVHAQETCLRRAEQKPASDRQKSAFLCTDEAAQPEQILAWFIRRWQVEVTFEEARAHLGMETQRQWSDRAIACTTPVILALYSIVALTARQLAPQDSLMIRHAAWYAKDSPTFSGTIALVRRSLWSEGIYDGSGNGRDMVKIPRALFDRLTKTVCYSG